MKPQLEGEVFEFLNGHFLVHPREACVEGPCPIHRPSLHAMVEEPMIFRNDGFSFGLIERQCRHGTGHPDPDSVAYLEAHSGPGTKGGTWGHHGCCQQGCCQKLTREENRGRRIIDP